jgi:FKBP-type peptidyl-prolyl cis-trans isomerase
MRWTRTSALVLTASIAVLAAACGSSTSPAANPPAGQPGSATTTTAATTTTTAASSGIAPVSMPTAAGTFGTKPPTVTVPTGAPPTVLESSDLISGTGAEAEAGDTITVQYVLVDYSTAKEIQSSWDTNMPFSFVLGRGQVIKGWDEGVVGMKVGGRRELIIPPGLAYGASPPPNSGIESNATLIFIVDLLKVG